MDLMNSLFVSVFGMTVVFFALVLLIAMINIISFALRKAQQIQLARERKAAGQATNLTPAALATGALAASPAVAPGQSGQPVSGLVIAGAPALKLTNVDEKTAAMIMAIVCDESGIPPQELYFKSIRLLES